MVRIIFFILITGFVGCASTVEHRKAIAVGAGQKNECSDEMQGSNVYGAIKCLLQNGATVNVMVDYQSAYDGLPDGYVPADFGCEADKETIIETEKIFLLDSFSKYPNFSVIDRSQINASFAEMKLGMSQVTVSNIHPGDISGASHLIVIEGKNHFFSTNGKNKDRYIEIKKLLDIQKDVAIAMDKLSEVRDIEYRQRHHAETKPVVAQNQEPPAQETSGLQQLPPRIEVTPAPIAAAPAEKAETIAIYGNHMQSDSMPPPLPVYQNKTQQNETITTVTVSGAVPNYQFNKTAHQSVRKIPDWQLARSVKQRFPDMRKQDNGTVIRHFIQKHPEYKERVIMTMEHKDQAGK